MATLAFVGLTAALAALVGGYAAWLALGRTSTDLPGDSPGPDGSLPDLDVLVAVHDESAFVAAKIADLRSTQYAGRVRFLVMDGASNDDTCARARSAIEGDPRFDLLELDHSGKSAQLNAGLAHTRAPWVAVTDADARMDPATLAALVAAGETDPRVGVVGVAAIPVGAHPLDALYWRAANRLRRAEARRGCVSHVLGPCYVFRRSLFPQLPEDVASDDCYVTFRAALVGQRVAWLEAPLVSELRAPGSLREIFSHKRRKAGGYLREILRFLPSVPRMSRPARTVFLWRVALLLLGPPLALAVIVAGLGLAWTEPAFAAALAVAGTAAVFVVRPLARAVPIAALVALGVVLTSAAGAALFLHPFRPPSPRLPKVGLGVSSDLSK
jgi:cellulose synthase/poly-beta-1,6-N-acetylglucosamine synthase-like glycosyltransferase